MTGVDSCDPMTSLSSEFQCHCTVQVKQKGRSTLRR